MNSAALAAILWLLPVAAYATSVYEEAATLLQRGQTDAAIHLLEQTLAHSPKDLKALTLMGMAYSAAGRPGDAGRQFSQALEIDPKFAPALKNLALNELAGGETAKARQHLEELLRLTPADPVAHLALAEILYGAKDPGAAIDHFRKSDGLYLREPRATIEFAQACVQQKQPEAADLLAHIPKDADAPIHFQAGTLLALLADYRGAARELELARDRYPDPYEVGYNLTLAYVKGANYPEAIRTAEALAARGYRKAELYNLLSQAYESTGRTREAYGALRTATQIDAADETNYIDLVALCLTHKNYDLALEIANIGLGRIPSSARLAVQRGIVFAMTEKFEDARKDFEAARTMSPEKGLPHVALGLILMQNDRTDDAISVLRRRVEAAPNDYIALWFLSEALNRSGVTPGSPQMAEALDCVDRSVRLNSDVAQSQMLLAKLLVRAGKLEPAEQHLVRALQLEPGNVSAMYQLAQVYSRKGDSARARELFAKVGKAKAEDREQFTSRGLAQIVREGAR